MKVRSEAPLHRHEYWLDAEHELGPQAKFIADGIFDRMIDRMVNAPRSLQQRIGPSEMGIPCTRALLHKLNKDPEPDAGKPNWKAQVGTACHSQQEEWFGKEIPGPTEQPADRWLVENSVHVTDIGPDEIWGSTDLMDTYGNAVIDWKFVGPTRLKTYRAKGPSIQYRKQGMLYGRGWELRGQHVDLVMIFFIPRDGELDDSYVWSAPYNPAEAIETIERNQQLYNLLQLFGIDAAVNLYPPCDDKFCDWCAPANQISRAGNPFKVS